MISIPRYWLTFPKYILTWFRNQKNWNFFRGYHFFGPSKILRFFENWPWKNHTNFYCRIVWYWKNEDVCKKLELKMLRIDWVMNISLRPDFFLRFLTKISKFLNFLNFQLSANFIYIYLAFPEERGPVGTSRQNIQWFGCGCKVKDP